MRRLKVVPRPGPGRIQVILAKPEAKAPLMSGPGDLDLQCGKCRVILVRGLGTQVEGMVLQCPSCRAFNEA